MSPKRIVLRSSKIWRHRWHYRCPKCRSKLVVERDGSLKSNVKDAVHPTRYCQAQHCDQALIGWVRVVIVGVVVVAGVAEVVIVVVANARF